MITVTSDSGDTNYFNVTGISNIIGVTGIGGIINNNDIKFGKRIAFMLLTSYIGSTKWLAWGTKYKL